MNTRRTHNSNFTFRLEGGTEDNDLWVHRDEENGLITSTWVPTDEERVAIANGENIELIVWGQGHPPVALRTTTVALGKAPDNDEGGTS